MQPEETHIAIMARLRALKPRHAARRAHKVSESLFALKPKAPGECGIDVCRSAIFRRGMCSSHYLRARNEGFFEKYVKPAKVKAICSDPDCGEFSTKMSMCDVHYSRDLRRRKREAAGKEAQS